LKFLSSKQIIVFPHIVALFEVGMWQVFKGGNYSREEIIVFLLFGSGYYSRKLMLFHLSYAI
jgi:hypothetical protein